MNTTALASVDARQGSILASSLAWPCQDLQLGADGESVRARFAGGDHGGWVEVTVVRGPPAPGVRTFAVLDATHVRYRGHLPRAADEAQRDTVRALVMGFAWAIESVAASRPEVPLVEALGRRAQPTQLLFSRAALRELLAPEIREGVALVDDWQLADIYPTAYVDAAMTADLELVVEFRKDGEKGPRRALFVVGPRRPGARGFAETAHFAISHRAMGQSEPSDLAPLRAWLGFILQVRDHAGLEVRFPDASADIDLTPALAAPDTPLALSDASDEGVQASLNLALQADCGQSCAFCSIHETLPPSDGGQQTYARAAADLAASRRRGVRRLRLNGYDPLAYSRVIDVLRHARALGYDEVEVFSPCTRLADLEFARAVVDLLPPRRIFHVPLYGVTAAVHDTLVGRAGAFAAVSAAIDHLCLLVGGASVHVLSVVCAGNIDDVPALASWCKERGLAFSAHLPYPSHESRGDRFFRAAPRQSDVVAAFVAAGHLPRSPQPFAVDGVAPCVVMRGYAAAGVPPRHAVVVPPERPLLPGTEYRDRRFRHGAGDRHEGAAAAATVPCPHAARCVLQQACSGELLRSYVELHGAAEFREVTLAELLAAG